MHPHSQFRGAAVAIERSLDPGEHARLDVPVRFDEMPGAVVENPFLILTLEESGARWRVLARVRITAGARGEPLAGTTIVITTNRIGES